MKLLVTGGAGYVGSHCVRALCAAEHEVVVWDSLALAGHREAVDPRAKLIDADLADTGLLDRTLADGFDGVLHFAAYADVNESVREPLRYYRNNVMLTVGLLELMRKHEIRRFVFSSTCATYGVPRAVPITEDMPQHPISPYGRSKLAMEWAIRDCARAWELGGTALRYFNASGAAADASIGEDHTPETHLIPIVLQVALKKRDSVSVFGVDYPTRDGTCVRDYIHVEDLADVHRIAIETQPAGKFRYYNVGTGEGVSVKEVIEACRDVTGCEIPTVPSPRREGDPPELYADPGKIMKEFGWQPKFTDIRRTVESAWNWHRTHPDGFPPA